MMVRRMLIVCALLYGCGGSDVVKPEPYRMDWAALDTAQVDAVSPVFGFRVSVAEGLDAERIANEIDAEWETFTGCYQAKYGIGWTLDMARSVRYFVTPGLFTCLENSICGGAYTPWWIVVALDGSSLPWLGHEWRHAYCVPGCPVRAEMEQERHDECVIGI